MAQAEIKARATLDGKAFEAGIAGMKQQVSGFASGQIAQLGGMIAGAFSVGAVLNFGRSMLETADQVQKASRKIGVTAAEYQSLQVLAQETGTEFGQLESSIFRMTKAQVEAESGNAKLQAAFEAMGVSMRDLPLLTKPELLQRLSKELRDNGDVATVAAAAYEIFGKGFGQARQTIEALANQSLPELSKSMQDNMQVMSDSAIEDLAEINDAYERLGRTVKVTGGNILVWIKDLHDAWSRLRAEQNAELESAITGKPVPTTMPDVAALHGPAMGPRSPAELGRPEPAETDAEWEKRQERSRREAHKDLELTDKTEAGLRKAYETADEKRRRAGIKLVQIQEEFDALAAGRGTAGINPQAADRFARMGMYVGAQANPMQGIAERQLEIQKKIEEYTKATRDEITELQRVFSE